MAQQEILDILKKNRSKKFTTKELGNIMDKSRNNICFAVRQLYKYGLVNIKKVKRGRYYQYMVWK